MDALCRIAEEHGLVLIEDAAQAHGAMYNGRRVGSFGSAACFSFYPGKNLGAFGEAGAVVTDDEELAARIRRLRDHAQDGRHHHVELGYNMRMEGIQGAVLEVKLRHLDRWNALRAAHAARYQELLADPPIRRVIPMSHRWEGLQLPVARQPEAHVWHLFVVLVAGIERERLAARLAEQGIATGIHYPTPIPFQPAYAYLGYRSGDFPVAENVMRRCLSLPMFPELSAEQIEHVASNLHIALRRKVA